MPSWSVTIPGPIPSTNHIYGYTGGRVYKLAGIESFQTVAAHLTKLARPRGWEPAKQVRITYWFYLNRRADCDNLLKMLNDAIASALGVDDDRFLPCARGKSMGVPKSEVRVEIEISNEDDE